MTNIPVPSIEWRNETSTLAHISGDSLTVLEVTIDPVKDDLQGQRLTCVAVAGDYTMYTESDRVDVQGISGVTLCVIVFYHSISPVPSESLTVETAVSDTGHHWRLACLASLSLVQSLRTPED